MKLLRISAAVLLAACLAAGCEKGGETRTSTEGSAEETGTTVKDEPVTEPAGITVDPAVTYQTWDGFGAMNLGTDWTKNTDWTGSDAKALLRDMGLNLMRIRIPYDESRWEALAQACSEIYSEYAPGILATPWSMPASMKTPEQTQARKDGVTSSLRPECYGDYAAYLERFAAYMKAHGAPLAAISVQNEPDYAAEYDGCLWSAAQHLDFVKNYGHLVKSAPLATAESFSSRQEFYDYVLEDDTACGNIAIVAGHLYGTVPKAYPAAAEKGKRLWMTEHLLNDSWSDGTDHWDETLSMAAEMIGCMECGWNAYFWWYGCRYYSLVGDDTEGTARGQILPRGYAYSQFSRYIQPGDVRVRSSVDGTESLLATAFEGNGSLKVVLLNTGSTLKEVTLDSGKETGSVSGTYSSSSAKSAGLTFSSKSPRSIIFTLPARSVATVTVR